MAHARRGGDEKDTRSWGVSGSGAAAVGGVRVGHGVCGPGGDGRFRNLKRWLSTERVGTILMTRDYPSVQWV